MPSESVSSDALGLEGADVLELEESDALELEGSGALELEESDALELEESDVLELEESGALELEESDVLELDESDTLELEESDVLELEESDTLELEGSGALELAESNVLEFVKSEFSSGTSVLYKKMSDSSFDSSDTLVEKNCIFAPFGVSAKAGSCKSPSRTAIIPIDNSFFLIISSPRQKNLLYIISCLLYTAQYFHPCRKTFTFFHKEGFTHNFLSHIPIV